MAIVFGPAHCIEARGQLAKTLIFETHGRRTYVKPYKVPTENFTPAALAVQAFTKLLMKRWPLLTAPERATWTPPADANRQQPINIFCAENWRRRHAAQPITDTWPGLWLPPTAVQVLASAATQPDLATWTASFAAGGHLYRFLNDVWADADLTSLATTFDPGPAVTYNLAGLDQLTSITFTSAGLQNAPTLTNLPALTSLGLSVNLFTTPPTFAASTALLYLYLNATPINTPPALTGLTALNWLNLDSTALTAAPTLSGLPGLRTILIRDCYLADVDTPINQIASDHAADEGGQLSLTGTNNAAITAASDAARAFLEPPNGNWTLTYNV